MTKGKGIVLHNKPMESGKIPTARVVEQAYECLSWTHSSSLNRFSQGLLSEQNKAHKSGLFK